MSKVKYKFLDLKGKNIRSRSGDLTWKVGEWQEVGKDVELCNRGLHCSELILDAFSYVGGEVIAEVETAGKSDKQNDKQAWQKMRIVRAWKWTKKDSVALSIFTAEACLANFEAVFPDDKRPREAVEAAAAWLKNPTKKNQDKASAAWSAAESAARSAAESAAWSAAESAARSAESAARSAAWSAESAAWSAAESAESAARSAAKKKAIKSVNEWMVARLDELEEIK